jgi:nitroreductase
MPMEGKILYELNRLLKNTDKFALKPIPKDIIENILKAGTYAPYGLNPPQPWKFIAITGDKALSISKKLDKKANTIILCFCAKVKEEYNQLTQYGSTSAAIYNMRIQAISYGIVSEVIFQLNENFKDYIYNEFNINPQEYEFFAILLLGYPAIKIEPKLPNREAIIWRIE